jgi:hypothetical protein
LGVIVFQTNLKLNGLYKIAALLASRFRKKVLDRAPHA